jgi:hypothetical protein
MTTWQEETAKTIASRAAFFESYTQAAFERDIFQALQAQAQRTREETLAEVERLQDAIRTYGDHVGNCPRMTLEHLGDACTCGFWDVRPELREKYGTGAALREPTQEPGETLARECVWTDDGEGNWDTGCGERYIILEGTPTQNDMRFCAFCGAALREPTQEPSK